MYVRYNYDYERKERIWLSKILGFMYLNGFYNFSSIQYTM